MLQSVFAACMTDEFTDVARQLDETLSEVNKVSDHAVKRKLLADMRRLIADADRLVVEAAKPKTPEKPTSRKLVK